MRSSLNAILANLENLYSFSVPDLTLATHENAVNPLLHTKSLIAQNIVDAARGRVTSLFPVKDFRKILDLREKEYQLTPLFDINAIHHYSPLLESFLTSDSIVIHVPFKSGDAFEVYQLELFPFFYERHHLNTGSTFFCGTGS